MYYHCALFNLIHTMYEVIHKSANGIMNIFLFGHNFLSKLLLA